jgi:PAS domain S-box-containing protein
VNDSAKSKNDFSVEASIPDCTVSLESILCTEQLRRRPWRPPDYNKENRALVALLSALVDSQSNILQTLADTILDVTQCDSSGLSLLTKDDGGKRFYWPAIAGTWKPHIGGGTPRDFGPCGDVLDHNCTLLFKHFERRYPYFLPVTPLVEECLLVPFYVGDKAVGTIWAIMHSDRRKFDAEDERVMSTLGQFASLAYQTLESIEDLKLQIAARKKAEAAVREFANGLEAKIRRLVDSNFIGICVWNLEGDIIEANEAFLHMLKYSREDLISGRVRWTDLTPAEWRDRDERAVAELKATGTAQPFQKEYFRKDGSRVPVLLGAAMFEGSGNEGVAFVLDLSEQKRAEDERKRAEEGLQKAQAELAHVARVTTLGELTATIAHEINQPLAAVVTNANASLRWLAGDSPNLDETRAAIRRIIRDGNRADEIIGRIRALAKKAPPQKDWLDLNETIGEVIAMARSEVQRNRVSLQTKLANDLPLILGDRIQLQQVILNLLINAIEAMSGIGEGPRELWVSSQKASEIPGESEEDTFQNKALAEAQFTHVLIAVRDSGPGLDPKGLDRLFDAFYTTKPKGLGMGLRISRSIIEAHGGRLWAKANASRGAIFQFALPIRDERTSLGY